MHFNIQSLLEVINKYALPVKSLCVLILFSGVFDFSDHTEHSFQFILFTIAGVHYHISK